MHEDCYLCQNPLLHKQLIDGIVSKTEVSEEYGIPMADIIEHLEHHAVHKKGSAKPRELRTYEQRRDQLLNHMSMVSDKIATLFANANTPSEIKAMKELFAEFRQSLATFEDLERKSKHEAEITWVEFQKFKSDLYRILCPACRAKLEKIYEAESEITE